MVVELNYPQFLASRVQEMKDESSNTMTKSSLSVKTLPPELSHLLYSATNHKATQVVAQLLERLKECLHQLNNEVISSFVEYQR